MKVFKAVGNIFYFLLFLIVSFFVLVGYLIREALHTLDPGRFGSPYDDFNEIDGRKLANKLK